MEQKYCFFFLFSSFISFFSKLYILDREYNYMIFSFFFFFFHTAHGQSVAMFIYKIIISMIFFFFFFFKTEIVYDFSYFFLLFPYCTWTECSYVYKKIFFSNKVVLNWVLPDTRCS